MTILNANIPKINLVCEISKATVKTISRQVEDVTKGHIIKNGCII